MTPWSSRRARKHRGLKKIERTYLNLVAVVSVFTALYLISQNWKSQLLLHNIKVYDAHILTDNEVAALADVQAGSPLYQVSLRKVSRRVEQNPFVREAIVVRALPYDLTITVHERNPIALVATPNSMLSVDDRGIILPLPLERKNDLPVITNVQNEVQVGDTARGILMQAVDFLADAQKLGPSLSASIAGVRVDGGNLVAYTTASSLPVIIGKGDFDRKLLYLQGFIRDVASTDNFDYSYVDLRFNGQIVVGTASGNSGRQDTPRASVNSEPAGGNAN